VPPSAKPGVQALGVITPLTLSSAWLLAKALGTFASSRLANNAGKYLSMK
jgi:hypothetical protein